MTETATNIPMEFNKDRFSTIVKDLKRVEEDWPGVPVVFGIVVATLIPGSAWECDYQGRKYILMSLQTWEKWGLEFQRWVVEDKYPYPLSRFLWMKILQRQS